jgi:hypothetical protein
VDRLNDFWASNYADLIEAAQKIAGRDGEELLHEMVIYLADRDVTELLDNGKLKYYVIGSMNLGYNSSNSPWHYKFRVPTLKLWTHWRELGPPEQIEPKHKEAMLQFVEEKLKEIPWFEAQVYKLVCSGDSYRKISRKSKIPETTLRKAYKDAERQIKRQVERYWRYHREDH